MANLSTAGAVCTRTRQVSWSFLLAPEAFPILGAAFLSNFKLLVDISNKRLVAHSGKLIQLEQGKRAKTVVVTEMVAAAPPPAVATPFTFTSHSGGTTLYTFNGGTQQQLPEVARGQLACRGGQEPSLEAQDGSKCGGSSSTNGGPLFTLTSQGGTQQRPHRAACSQPARRSGQEASPEVQGRG